MRATCRLFHFSDLRLSAAPVPACSLEAMAPRLREADWGAPGPYRTPARAADDTQSFGFVVMLH